MALAVCAPVISIPKVMTSKPHVQNPLCIICIPSSQAAADAYPPNAHSRNRHSYTPLTSQLTVLAFKTAVG